MKCYDFEQLITFAMNPAKSENLEIISHIAECSDCRSVFDMALETMTEEVEHHADDKQVAQEAVSAFFKKKSAWNSFIAFFEKAVAKLQEQTKKGLPFLNASQLFAPAAQPVFASSGSGLFSSSAAAAPSFSSLPTVTFEADTPDCSDYYWKIQMAFPMSVSANAMITRNVKDKAGKNLTKGTLLFLGKEFSITMGQTLIPFKEFQNNRLCASIGVRFPDGGTVAGSIKFLPEPFA